MGIIRTLGALFQTDRGNEEESRREEAVRTAFKARCACFKALLSANKRALEAMAGLEEAMRGERFFSLTFVRAGCTTVLTNVYNMVRNLNDLCGNAHAELFERLKEIRAAVTAELEPKEQAASGPLVLPLEQTGFALSHEVGGKMASLGEARRNLCREIPAGFVITAAGWRRFIEAGDLREEIARRVQMADVSSLEEIFALSDSLQGLIESTPLPKDLAEAIAGQAARLAAADPTVRFAVRSSAGDEDAQGASFAGQYRTELNIAPEHLAEAYRRVAAGKYGVTAMSYRLNRGIPDDEVPMCVGVLAMARAVAGGVAYSLDSENPDSVLINAVPGLPQGVVDGSGEVDVFRVSRAVPHVVTARLPGKKKNRLVCDPVEGVTAVPLGPEEREAPCLSEAQALEVVRLALGLEAFYGRPQDVEWAFDHDGRLLLLQSRALPGGGSGVHVRPAPEGARVLLEGGVCAAPGAGAGKVFFLRRKADMLRFPQGAVLAVEQAHARWAPVLSRAAAVVAASGGAAGHLAGVAREYGIPAVFSLAGVMEGLCQGDEVTVDADSGRVFEGRQEELLQAVPVPRRIFAGSPVHTVLAKVIAHVVPLNLLHPDAPTFAPAYCRTLHDITRFSHEKAVEEMFRLDESIFSGRCGKQLKYKGAKLQYYVVNLENGFCDSVEGRYVDIDQICSLPMLALWKGMIAIPWAGPPTASARGFLAVVAESAANPELEVTSSAGRMLRNYFMIDRNWCNLQASFGYHFCTVEAQAGEEERENYVSFHFKGGAANLARRVLRVHSVADVLAENGFIVDVREDALSARAEELSADEALELLRIIGYLLVHTRQMDASLHGEDSRTSFADVLRKGVAEIVKGG